MILFIIIYFVNEFLLFRLFVPVQYNYPYKNLCSQKRPNDSEDNFSVSPLVPDFPILSQFKYIVVFFVNKFYISYSCETDAIS